MPTLTPRRALALAATAGVVLAVGACSSTASEETASGDAVQLIDEGTLTLCTNPPYEPFEYEEDGEIVGLDIAIVGEVAADLDAELATLVTPFEGIQSGQDLESGNCDIVASGITITDEREEKMDFSDPYFDADQGLLVPAGSGLDSAEALEGLKVGVQAATTGETWATDEGLSTVQFEDLGLQVEALRSGQIDAAINDIAVLGPFVDDSLEIGTTFTTGEQYGLGVKTGNTALLDAVNATLERIREDGTYDDLYTQYIGTAPTED
ncbi:transporter substrate-binding domain-containing protein [Actinotalea subterranea]|uniref:transporter substrate-binding domain-containing protein n=1 Tax=Actinotalea subterranea TaxID=2607497 RepID=UPI0011EC4FC7|nr:transporter substrate-binding domain-containing protein [Actinotalea subterranea]